MQTVKLFQLSEDAQSLVLFPSAEGLALLKKKYPTRLSEIVTTIAGKNVNALSLGGIGSIRYWEVKCKIHTNEVQVYAFTTMEERLVVEFPYDTKAAS
jgi:hypothetical protein